LRKLGFSLKKHSYNFMIYDLGKWPTYGGRIGHSALVNNID